MNFSVSSRYDCMFTIQSDYSIDTNNLTKHRDVAAGCISTENRIVFVHVHVWVLENQRNRN